MAGVFGRDLDILRKDCLEGVSLEGEKGKRSDIAYAFIARFDPSNRSSTVVGIGYPYHEVMEDGADWVTFLDYDGQGFHYVNGMPPGYSTDYSGLVTGWCRLSEVPQPFLDDLDIAIEVPHG